MSNINVSIHSKLSRPKLILAAQEWANSQARLRRLCIIEKLFSEMVFLVAYFGYPFYQSRMGGTPAGASCGGVSGTGAAVSAVQKFCSLNWP